MDNDLGFKRRYFTVSEVSYYIKNLIQSDVFLSDIYIKGEVSNYKKHTSGHVYFTLKDDEAKIRVVMFKNNSSRLKFELQDGLSILIHGYLSLYEKDGQYQLYATDIHLEGIGELYKAFEQLKLKLEAEGIFAPHRKKTLPYLPSRIGIITSPTGAAVRDIISILKRRFSSVDIFLYPVQVQGETAAFEIAKAIDFFNENQLADVIIVGRGGGSIEELWAFNEEIVARTIHASNIPIISAVGHETDFTISDFASDLRAATPSAAAELAVPDKMELKKVINQLNYNLNSSIIRIIQSRKLSVQAISKEEAFKNIEKKILNFRQTIDILDKYLQINIMHILNVNKNLLENYTNKLSLLNPASALTRGYTLTINRENNKLINSVKEINIGDFVNIKLQDGIAEATITNIKKGE